MSNNSELKILKLCKGKTIAEAERRLWIAQQQINNRSNRLKDV